MSDTPGLPPGWPTDDHRARVAARAHALRNRRHATRSTIVALAVVMLAGGFITLRGRYATSNVDVATASSTTNVTPTTASMPPEVHAVATPKGWRVVDFGEARLAAPPSWSVTSPGATATPCAPLPEKGISLFSGTPPACSSIVVEPMTTAALRGLERTIYDGTPAAHPGPTIHGVTLYLVLDTGLSIRYAVPQRRVFLTIRGRAGAQQVLDTLGPSARRVVLAKGPAPRVPSDWRTLTFGGITLRVPPTMPRTRIGPNDLWPGACKTQTFVKPGAYIGNGFPGAIHCPSIPAGVVATPTDGVWIHTIPEIMPSTDPVRFIEVAGIRLRIELSKSTLADPTLTIEPIVPGRHLPTSIRLGLGADPTVARTILYSIRATDRPG